MQLDSLQTNTALDSLDSAIDKVSSSVQVFTARNRLDASINNLTTLQVNTDAARSKLKMLILLKKQQIWKSQILSQAATSMLAQANASKQNLLALLRDNLEI